MAIVKDFSVEEKLVSLIRLQKLDSKLDQIQILKGELPMEVSDLEDELAGLNSRKNRIEEEINGISDYINERKNIISESEALVKKYEKQSENVKNNREFEAINKEIEMQQLEGKLAEKHIRDANIELAEKVKALDAAKKKIDDKTAVLDTKKEELGKIIAETEKEETAVKKQIDKAREDIDERLLFSYDRIRNNYRNGLAVVAVERDACGGCYNAIPPQKQSEIRQRKKVIVCENCGRILTDEDLAESVVIK
ncbi:MAG: C4-type zinc ribbon domain-containing protein [Arachidicoccus sp.]|nr:C4-type zinc ribbon domain-containing protein [Arachidicoccus sp.]